MESFSLWHWLVILLILSPVLIGIAVMGIQRSVLLRHESSGLTKKGFYGYSWTYLLFGWLVPIFRGEIGIGLVHLIFSVVSLGLFQVFMPYLYNRQYMTRLLTTGWVLADANNSRNEQARRRLRMMPRTA